MRLIAVFSPELSIKSPKVKSRFVLRLCSNIQKALKATSHNDAKIVREWSRLYITLENGTGLEVLKRIFGIHNFFPIDHSVPSQLQDITATVEKYKDLAAGKSICVRVKGASKVLGRSTKDLEVLLGGKLRAHARKVDLSNPELKLVIDVRADETLFYHESIKGAGGLPLGVEGRALCLISGGFDSAVAAWQLMRRGVSLDFVFMNLAGSEYERDVLRVTHLLVRQWGYGASSKFHSLDFFPVMDAIRENGKDRFAQVILKRAFYKAANLVADELHDIPALVTGEAIGQVSSQTLHNLSAVDEASRRLVLRPLVAYDKNDIIDLSRHIGTQLLCEKIKEYCGLNPKRPLTKGNRDIVKDEEERAIPYSLYQHACENRKVFDLWDLDEDQVSKSRYSVDKIEENAVVVDVRDREHFKQWHYQGAQHIPLDSVLTNLDQFDTEITYVFYCTFGMQTAVVAEEMQKRGFQAFNFSGGTFGITKYARKHNLDW